MDSQLNRLVQDAIDSKLLSGEAKSLVHLLFEATMSFHHPVLVSQHMHEEREELLRSLLNSLYKGLA